jgi:Ca2+:H+ antiporter
VLRKNQPGIAATTVAALPVENRTPLKLLMAEIRHNKLLWLLGFVPVLFAVEKLKPESHALLFVLSIVAIVPFAVLISRASEGIVAKTGDTIGALLNATLSNLTEMIIALAALNAGQHTLVKASIAGAIVTKTLFTLGASFLAGGLKHHVQQYNRDSARLQAGLLFLAAIALLVPSLLTEADSAEAPSNFSQALSLALSGLIVVCYGLSMLFSLKTHPELFGSVAHAHGGEGFWPVRLSLVTLGVATVLMAVASEIFVESVQSAGETFGMTPAFIGFIIVPLVSSVAELAPALTGARNDRLDLSVGIALGGASQIVLLVAPVLVFLSYVLGPTPMTLHFWPAAVLMVLIAIVTATLVTNSGRSAWFIGVFVLNVYVIFAVTLYLLPAQSP